MWVLIFSVSPSLCECGHVHTRTDKGSLGDICMILGGGHSFIIERETLKQN